MGIFDRFSTNSGSNFASRFSSNSINNLVILITFIVMVYILVQMIIVLNKPEFLYYTLSLTPTDLSEEDYSELTDSNKLPEMFANEFTYSFWIYLKSVKSVSSDGDGKNKLIFTRNVKENYFKDANPIVYFKGDTNKLVIKIRTNHVDESQNPDIEKNLDEIDNDICEYSMLEVDYIPLKRWVNIIVNVDNNRVTLFVDGDIYKTILVNNNPDTDNCADNSNISRLISPSKGTIQVGSFNDNDDEENSIYTPNALISKLQFYNYSLKTPSDIRKIYSNGPITQKNIFLDRLGIDNYGIRNPIYNIQENNNTCN
jgi:hypothetical protein